MLFDYSEPPFKAGDVIIRAEFQIVDVVAETFKSLLTSVIADLHDSARSDIWTCVMRHCEYQDVWVGVSPHVTSEGQDCVRVQSQIRVPASYESVLISAVTLYAKDPQCLRGTLALLRKSLAPSNPKVEHKQTEVNGRKVFGTDQSIAQQQQTRAPEREVIVAPNKEHYLAMRTQRNYESWDPSRHTHVPDGGFKPQDLLVGRLWDLTRRPSPERPRVEDWHHDVGVGYEVEDYRQRRRDLADARIRDEEHRHRYGHTGYPGRGAPPVHFDSNARDEHYIRREYSGGRRLAAGDAHAQRVRQHRVMTNLREDSYRDYDRRHPVPKYVSHHTTDERYDYDEEPPLAIEERRATPRSRRGTPSRNYARAAETESYYDDMPTRRRSPSGAAYRRSPTATRRISAPVVDYYDDRSPKLHPTRAGRTPKLTNAYATRE